MAKLSTVLVILLHLVFLQKMQTSSAQVHPNDLRKIHPSQISTITLVAGALTTSRKAHYLKQIQCFGSYCHVAQVLKATCRNTGFDGRDIQWACEYLMQPEGYKVDRFTVNCESYDFIEDVNIVEGSCGLEYSIASSFEIYEMDGNGWQGIFVLLIVIILLVLCVAVCATYGPPTTTFYRGYGGYHGYGGGTNIIMRPTWGGGGGTCGGVTTGTAFGGTTRRGGTPTFGGGIGGFSTGTAFGGTTRR